MTAEMLPERWEAGQDSLLPGPAVLPRDRNPAVVYIARLSPGSRRTMHGALTKLCTLASDGQMADPEVFPWHLLRYQHTAVLRAKLIAAGPDGRMLKPATVRRHLAALRGVLKEAWKLGLVSGDDYQRATELEAPPGKSLPAGRHLTPQEIVRLVQAAQSQESPVAERDLALLAILRAGLRRHELCGLDLADWDPDGWYLNVRVAKGGKQRRVYPPAGSVQAISAWLSVRGDLPGPLLLPVTSDRTAVVPGRRMSASSVYKRALRLARLAGVRPFGPHDMRRTMVGDLLETGADLSIASRVAGHRHVTTTQGYDRRPEHEERDALRRIVFPYGT